MSSTCGFKSWLFICCYKSIRLFQKIVLSRNSLFKFQYPCIFWIFQIPEETCTLTPKKQCKHVTKLVPNLKPVEDCIDVSCYKKLIRIRCQIRWIAFKIPIFLNFRCRRKFAQITNYRQGRSRNQSQKSGATLLRNQKFTKPH